ncbi:MAG: response regulator [Pseudomonadales bacterium]|nr:response regulator [Pseudomonadales bacterium]
MAKILVVDDSEVIRAQLTKDLTGAGHDVVEAYDGLNGIDQLKTHDDIKLIICDVNMPEMDGLTMCETIHQDNSIPQLPIVMLTTQSNVDMKTKSKEFGVVAWIIKPHKPAVLINGVNKILSL